MAFKLLKYTWLFMEPPCKNEMPSSHYHGSVENDAIAKGTSLGGNLFQLLWFLEEGYQGPTTKALLPPNPWRRKMLQVIFQRKEASAS